MPGRERQSGERRQCPDSEVRIILPHAGLRTRNRRAPATYRPGAALVQKSAFWTCRGMMKPS